MHAGYDRLYRPADHLIKRLMYSLSGNKGGMMTIIRITMLFITLSIMPFTILPASGGTPADMPQSGRSATVLITGSNRGIGFEFARQYAQKGWTVIATARRPESADDLKALAVEYPNVP